MIPSSTMRMWCLTPLMCWKQTVLNSSGVFHNCFICPRKSIRHCKQKLDIHVGLKSRKVHMAHLHQLTQAWRRNTVPNHVPSNFWFCGDDIYQCVKGSKKNGCLIGQIFVRCGRWKLEQTLHARRCLHWKMHSFNCNRERHYHHILDWEQWQTSPSLAHIFVFLQTQMRTQTHDFPRKLDRIWQRHYQSTGINGRAHYTWMGIMWLMWLPSIPQMRMHQNHTFQRREDIPYLHCRYSIMHLPTPCKNVVFGGGKAWSMGFMQTLLLCV